MTKQELLNWAKENYDTEPEYLWEKNSEYAVLRSRDGKKKPRRESEEEL